MSDCNSCDETNNCIARVDIPGPRGPQGNQGAAGPQGAQGADGVDGAQGFQGLQGTNGSNGAQGFQGLQGSVGVQGAQGFQGVQGSQGFQGSQGADGIDGVQGAQGFQGLQGNQGSQGSQGFQGPADGAQGFQGEQGNQGFQGLQGNQGFQGLQGNQGFQGEQGDVGAQGFQGEQGNQGFQGEQGAQGTTTGSPNFMAAYDSAGDLNPLTTYGTNGFNADQRLFQIDVNDGMGNNLNNYDFQFRPLQDSPNEGWNISNCQLDIDPDSSGFTFGTNGNCASYQNFNFTHHGTSNIGRLETSRVFFGLGNGTDVVDVRGISHDTVFADLNNITISGSIEGWTFNMGANSGTVFNEDARIFSDNANFSTIDCRGWESFRANPLIGSIANNHNYVGFNINPSVTTFNGNAGGFGIAIGGNWGTFDTGGFNGISVNPNVTSCVNATGLYINMNNVTASGSKRAIDVTGDVNINGALTFTGGLTIGQLSSFSSLTLAPSVGPGQPTTQNGLVCQLNGTANTINADTLGINTAALINIDPGVAITTSFVGIAALGLPAVANIGAGASVDTVAGALFALSLGGGSGTIDNVYLCRALSIPDGTTTVNKLYGYAAQLPFGSVGTSNWGFYESGYQQNYMEHALKIGGTPGSNDAPSNASVGLEIDSTTKAILLSRMNTAARDALTAINGMLIYNTQTNKFQGYENGAWADLI